MTIIVNGKEETIQEQTILAHFLASKNLDPEKVVVELNLDIVNKENLTDTILKENDNLEILRFVGGG